MPVYDSVSFEVQREFTRDLVMRVGYVGTKGTGLFESVDANPTRIAYAERGQWLLPNDCKPGPNTSAYELRHVDLSLVADES